MESADPYQPPGSAVALPELSRPFYCWVVLAVAVVQCASVARFLYRTSQGDPHWIAWFFSAPDPWLALLVPTLHMTGAVLFFRLRWKALIFFFAFLLLSAPYSFTSWQDGAKSTAFVLTDLAYQLFTLAYGLRLLRVGRLR